MKSVLILGSAPDAMRAKEFDFANFSSIVAINNAWRVRNDWTHLIHPEDFPTQKRPDFNADKKIVTHEEYVPGNNVFGGIIYAGGTMAFTAAYWALSALRPDLMIFCGCDMVYDKKSQTHFYGTGEADPLRKDPTLQSLEAKSNRLMLLSENYGCLCANVSNQLTSRLTFPRIDGAVLGKECVDFLINFRGNALENIQQRTNKAKMEEALSNEIKHDCFVKTGDYWNHPEKRDGKTLAKIDALWLEAFSQS